jgi:Xaa-Pro aminopeptidase
MPDADDRPQPPRFTEAFAELIPRDWAPYPDAPAEALRVASFTPLRRDALGAAYPGERLVIPAGGLKARNNDGDFGFRSDARFAHLTGLGTDREPDAALVLEPTADGHAAVLFFKPRAPRTDPAFYADHRYGEMWVGQRESLDDMATLTGLACRPIAALPDAVAAGAASTSVRIVRGLDHTLDALVDALRAAHGQPEGPDADAGLSRQLAEQRLVKDDFEIAELQRACDATASAFDGVAAAISDAVGHGRGERWIEGVFNLHARHLGNGIGFDTIAAAGDHACTLHWTRNDGDVAEGDLLLVDAGVEVDSLYTGDVTRTLPVSGRFTEPQRRVYQAVLDAQAAAIAAAKPGVPHVAIHDAAVRVIAERLHAWGLLPVTVDEALDPYTGGQHRRWMVHGTSHHLGLDVHDCAQARPERERGDTLRPGMVVTVEPGLYFKATDLLVPEELRGIGVRIEDDIVITDDGCRVLSEAIPRTVDAVEAWVRRLR